MSGTAAKPGITTGEKVVMLAGAAALHYMYKHHQSSSVQGEEGQKSIMGLLDGLLDQVKDAVTQHTRNPQTFDSSKLLGHIPDLFSKHPSNGPGNAKPASQDPYGDPGAGQRNVKPASQDHLR